MITIKDPGQTLSQGEQNTLSAKANAYPFDIHVLIGSDSSRSDFEQQVASFVPAGSHVVSIGVDPVHHFTFVRSSAALGVPAGPQVAQAGNPFFKRGDLANGIDAIAAKANDLKVAPVAVQHVAAGPDQKVYESQTGVPIIIQENHTSSGVWWGTGTFLVVASLVVAWFVWRNKKARKAADEARETATIEAAEYAAKNIAANREWELLESRRPKTENLPTPPATPRDVLERVSSRSRKTVTVVQPAPVVVNQGSNNTAMDMLIGYEIAKEINRPVYSPPPVIERVVETSAPSSSFWSSSSDSDSSSSSSWSSSSDSSSSSSWYRGSSFDSGGSSSGSDW